MDRSLRSATKVRTTRCIAPLPDFSDLSLLAPQRAGDLVFRHFCEPWRSERRSPDHHVLVARARPLLGRASRRDIPTVDGAIPVYIFSPADGGAEAPAVLVVHGWTSESSFMGLFAERLVRSGFRAVLMDGPAHGRALQRRVSLIDWTRAILAVADAVGPFEAAVAHSMGALAVLLAGAGCPPYQRRHDFKSYVLISAPNRLSVITREFADARRLSARARWAFERHLERLAHRTLASFTGANLLRETGAPALLVHATDDHEVPYANALEIADACPEAQLMPFDGLGHRRILSQPAVVRAAVGWLAWGSRNGV